MIITRLKEQLKCEAKKTILKNIFFLGIVRGSNILLPLIVLPYLVKVLGVDKFGLIAFATSFMRFFTIVTDYGFNLTATRDISINRGDLEKVSEIVSSVYIIKLSLTVLSFAVLMCIVSLFSKFSNDYILYIFSFGSVVGNMLFPIWFFQGMEQMKYITILNFISKLIFTVLIFVIIKKTEHFIYVPVINSMGFIFSGLCALAILKRQFCISFKFPSWTMLQHQAKEGWHIFVSSVAISLYRDANTLILGLFSTNTIVGYYATAERIVKSAQLLLDPISQALFPNISNRFVEANIVSAQAILMRIAKYYFVILSAMVSALLLFIPLISKLIWGVHVERFVCDVRILSFVVFFGGFNYLLGVIGLINLNFKKEFTLYVLIAGVTNIISCVVLVQSFQDMGCSIALLTSEIVMFVLCSNKILRLKHGGTVIGNI